MLKKLLKYDFKAVMRFWWIAAAASTALAAVCGVCSDIRYANENVESVRTLMNAIEAMSMIGIAAFAILPVVLIGIRFYKNFFTDEGYLTFTLPVKLTDLIHSKLLMGVTVRLISGVVLILNVLMIEGFVNENSVFSPSYWNDPTVTIDPVTGEAFVYGCIYLAEILAIAVVLTVLSELFLSTCITFACMLVRKARIITAIGIYYGANQVLTISSLFFLLPFLEGIERIFQPANDHIGNVMIALMLLGVIVLLAMLCGVLYLAQYRMLDRKLNLN